MNIEEILEDMDDTIDRAHPIPFASHKVIVDADRLRELINDIRLNIPAEIKRAKLIDFDCERIINEARAKAEQIVQDAEMRAKQLCSEEAVQKEARQRGADMLMRAQRGSNEIKAAAEDYVNRLLSDAEAYFAAGLQEVKQTKNKIENRKNKPRR
ncbi:MAG: vacuolar-type H+-ATPase subunit H [Ruminococcus sp.]